MAKRHRSKRIKTKAGYWVQSKSEAKIDNWLYEHRLNYVYEPVFWIGNKRISPDWIILPTPALGITQSIIIEYWGLSYDTETMKTVSQWVRNAAPKYNKRKNMKEKAYKIMNNYDYIGINPNDCAILEEWLPTALNQLLKTLAFQMEDESSPGLPESKNHNQSSETIQQELKLKWRRIPQQTKGHAS